VSVYSEGAAAAGADVPAFEAAEALNFSTSSRKILPSGPVPLTCSRGIPRARAIFLAIGVAKIRSPLGRLGFESVSGLIASVVDLDLDSGAGLDSSFLGGSSDLAGFSDSASLTRASAPAMSSPSSARMAMGAPTSTFLEPSPFYRGN
jgi:hypothetical protein